jgi:uncharacterized membrane protein
MATSATLASFALNNMPKDTFPFLGNGMAIGLDAVLHVILGHGFAIGAFSLLVFCEYWGWRKGLPVWNDFAHRYLKFLAIVITAAGAITGLLRICSDEVPDLGV